MNTNIINPGDWVGLGFACGMVFLGGCSRDPLSGDFDRPLTAGYHLICTSGNQIEVSHMQDSLHPGVPAKVVAIGWNDQFIVAEQQELRPRGDFKDDTLLIPVPGKFKYWIIDTGKTNRYGPLSREEFAEKLKSLGQAELKLNGLSKAKKS